MTYRMRSYADWESYIAGGRKKYERTLYDRGLRIKHANKFKRGGDIEIVIPWLNNFPIITIHPDDTMTLRGEQTTTHWGGSYSPLKAQSSRYTLWKYAGIEVVQRNFKFRLFEEDAALTPPKIQGCRTCNKTGKVDGWCNGSTCWDVNQLTGKCPNHPDATLSDIEKQRGRHTLLCEHNETKSHKVARGFRCYGCSGTGKRDYGSKRVSLLWDGSPIKVKDRKIYKQPLTDLERIVASYVRPTPTV
jgi:hypothetical protein